jgi:dTDP-4-amino-4,6-dideoxygalactose transaminase
MIPRTKVNYTAGQLFKALFISDKSTLYSEKLTSVLQKYLGVQSVLLVPSGRAGLYFILKAIDKKRVLIPAYTCKAVTEAALLAGKTIDYVEVEDHGFNMSMAALETALDEDSIVIATHQFGIPCDIERTMQLARSKRALVVEDSAPSLGTQVNGKMAGSFGDAAFFSFDSTKLITVPMKGGAITAKDPELFARIRTIYLAEIRRMPLAHKLQLLLLAALMLVLEYHMLYSIFHCIVFSSRGRFTSDTPDVNLLKTAFYRYNLANWQSYIALEQLDRIEQIIQNRRKRYMEFQNGLKECRAIELPPPDDRGEWACIRFPIRVRSNKMRYYKRACRHGVDFAFSFTYLASPRTYQKAWRLAQSVLDLPFYAKICDSEMRRVIAALKSIDGATEHDS